MVQLAKTRGIEASVLEQCAPSLNPAQLRRLLTNYVPDEFEDGPVPAALIRQLSASETTAPITLKTVDQSGLLMQIQLPEILPQKLALSTDLPPALWKLLVLYQKK